MTGEYLVPRDQLPDLAFPGVRIAAVNDRGNNADRWLVVEIYRTAGGRYIVARTRATTYPDERDQHEAIIAEDVGEITGFLGFGPLAKEAYQQAGIDAAERVE